MCVARPYGLGFTFMCVARPYGLCPRVNVKPNP